MTDDAQRQDPLGNTSTSGAGTIVIVVLSLAMFIYVIDTTLMNVSISALVEDLDTTIGAVQAAITLYTLTMAAFMLTGGQLGSIWGSKQAFRIGLVVYGIGTTITALSPNIFFVMLGWSILEGLGSALIVPAINTLVRANYKGSMRATAYGVLFGVAAAGAAFGPLIGGWLTTNLSWRVAFGAEAAIVVIVLLASPRLIDAPPVVPKPKLDGVGVILSAFGLGLVVFAVLQTTALGWTDPLVLSMLTVGFALLAVFVWWVTKREREGKPGLISPSIFRHRSISAGLPILATQTFAQAGLLFLVPLFAQTFLGMDALQTGFTILPLSIAILITSVTSPGLGKRFYPKYVILVGLLVIFVGGTLIAVSLEGATSGADLALGLAIAGVGIGLVVAQLPNLVLSGVEPNEASEASGLQGTAQNLGMALGTAVIGTVIISISTLSFGDRVAESSALPDEIKDEVALVLEDDFTTAGVEGLEEALAEATPETRAEAARIYEESVVNGFQAAMIAGALVAALGAVLTLLLPKEKLGAEAKALEQAVRTPVIPKMQLEMTDIDSVEA